MKGRKKYFDSKLNQHPIVVIEKIPETKPICKERDICQLNAKNSCEEECVKKRRFLLNFDLISKKDLKEVEFLTANQTATKGKIRLLGCKNKTHFCCSGLAGKSSAKWLAEPSCHWEVSRCNYEEKKKFILMQLKVSPRICVKKWLGGDRIINSKSIFGMIEQSLIPKTANHSSCIEKPKICSFSEKCGSMFTEKTPVSEKKIVNNYGTSEALNVAERNGDIDIHTDSSNHLITNSLLIKLNNGVNSPKLSMQDTKFKKTLKSARYLRQGHEEESKELLICLRRWEGKHTISDSKELQTVENILTVPTGSSHRACKKVNVKETPGSFMGGQLQANSWSLK